MPSPHVVLDCLVGDDVTVNFTTYDETGRQVVPTAVEVTAGLPEQAREVAPRIDERGEGTFTIAPGEAGVWGFKIAVSAPVRTVREGLIRVDAPIFDGGNF